uniref:MIA SH3 domain containing n=1 Tax=Cyprinus carpio TaxID=7962 RepID=A0A8C1YFW9_CYPCA
MEKHGANWTLLLVLCGLLPLNTQAGRQMPKLSDNKLCADSECSRDCNYYLLDLRSYYGDQEARLGYFPSSVVEETHALMPAEVEVKTDKWDFYCY